MTTTYDKVIQLANSLQAEGKYDSTYSAVLAIYQNLTGDTETKFDSTYSIVVRLADGIESGDIDLGGGSESDIPEDFPLEINFYNYKGEVVETWTLEEAKTKTELPAFKDEIVELPSGVTVNLIQEGWNWDLDKLQVTTASQNVGALYRPSDNKTRITVKINPENLSFYLHLNKIYNNPSCVIDWGDGILENITNTNPTHTYLEAGYYTITILEGKITQFYYGYDDNTKLVNGYPIWYYTEQIHSIISTYDLEYFYISATTNLEFVTFCNEIYTGLFGFHDTGLKNIILPKTTSSIYFRRLPNTELISFPYGITRLYDYIISNTVKSVNIPDSVTTLDSGFFQTPNLRYLSIPTSILFNGYLYLFPSFYGGDKIAENNIYFINANHFINDWKGFPFMNLNAGVRNTYIYSNGKLLKDVDLTIDEFYRPNSSYQLLNNFNKITINSIKSNTSYLLYSFRGWNEAVINAPIETITDSLGFTNSSFKKITLPNTITDINTGFKRLYNLTEITIPESVTTFSGFGPFEYCANLKKATILSSADLSNDFFSGCSSLEEVNLSDDISVINGYAFEDCISLKYIKFPASLAILGSYCFDGVSYATLDFTNCTQVPELASSSYMSTCIIKVPSSLYDEWIAATNWSSLTNQIIAV